MIDLEEIKDERIKRFTEGLLCRYTVSIATMPTSLSLKYHTKDPLMVVHLARAFKLANDLCREFDIRGVERDIILSAILLHDIGKLEWHKKGNLEGCYKYFPESNWCKLHEEWMHPLDGGIIVRRTEFKYANQIAELIESHMSHWTPQCPQPKTLAQYIICSADYLSSREYLDIGDI